MPTVSVIIPCFNQGAFVDEAIDSVLAQHFDDVEIVVVDDGSTDPATRHKLATYQREKTSVIITANQGLAAARNNGIAAATGRYILPLDADDRIAPSYLQEAVAVLDAEPDIGIVYCRARLFGAVEGDWHLPDYSLEEMLRDNVIFCTALFRRADWELVGGYDPGMRYGWEDYEFWLSLIERGRQVKRLDGRYFFYRVSPDSMVRSKDKQQKISMFKRIYQRHTAFIGDHIEVWLEALLADREPYRTARLYIDSGAGLSDDQSIARKVVVGSQTLHFTLAGFPGRRALRFDPIDCPVRLTLDSIEVHGSGGNRLVDPATVRSNARLRIGNDLLFDTDDPQVHLPLPMEEVVQVAEVVISLTIKAVAEAALRAVIDEQQRRLDKPKRSGLLGKILPFPRNKP